MQDFIVDLGADIMMVKNAKESMDFFDRRTQTAKVRKITSNKYTRN